MNPQYKFELSANGTTQRAFPIYRDDLAKDFEKESGQEFFRAKLSEELTFTGNDYGFIVSQSFDTQFTLEIFISYDNGQTWESYWRGTFWKTDCEFNSDDNIITVRPVVLDQYNDILAGLEKEYNLIDLAPEIAQIKADKRPMIQVYVPGQSVIACFLSGMWWEQECDVVNETDRVEIGGVSHPALTDKYFFSLNKTFTFLEMEGETTPQLPSSVSNTAIPGTVGASKYFDFVVGDYRYARQAQLGNDVIAIYSVQTGMALWRANIAQNAYEVVLQPVAGQGVTGTINMKIFNSVVYARFVCDTESINGTTTQELPSDDLVANNRNYTRVTGYYFPETIWFSTEFTNVPNQWGIYQPGQYYKPPYLYWDPELFPVSRNAWGRISIWFIFSDIDELVERSGRQAFTIKHAYPIWSVISVLLAKVAPGISHAGTTNYSQFLYGTNLLNITQNLFITPKSNIVSAGYDQPAQKAPITLKAVFDMLRDCFRCYWFIDDQNRLRVEHIEYFRNGGSYSELPVVGIDLTAERVLRNGKPWAFAANKFTFDKPETAARYQFGWMDDVTQLFEGYPIDIISKFVNPDNIEEINVSKFTSDIDYILLNSPEISKDGFVLLSAGNANILPGPISVETRLSDGYAKLFDYSQGYGNTAVTMVEVSDGYADYAFYDSSDNMISLGRRFFAGQVERIIIEVPDGTAYVGVISSIPGATVTVSSVVPDQLALLYVNINDNDNDHILQNGLVSFAFLQQYYAYDMPAPNYAINGEEMEAIGTKRLKTQQINFPSLYDPDLVKQIRTGLGNGTIQKISLTLSSRNANATLKYDTE